MPPTTDTRAMALAPRGFGQTTRRDAWWATPLATFLVLSAFVVYATWAAFQNAHYTFGPYLSPFYSPEIFGDSPHAWFGAKPGWWPSWLPFSPALLILPFPGFFRLTCYYYRGAYYKAFWADPPSCAVGEPRSGYRGERSFPLIMQNVHRYFLYAALGFLVVLSWDVWEALWFTESVDGPHVLRHRRRHARARRQRGAARRLHARLPLAAPSRGRADGRGVQAPHAGDVLRVRELPQPPAHADRLVQPGRGRVRRPLRSPLLDGHLDRLENPVASGASEVRWVIDGSTTTSS